MKSLLSIICSFFMLPLFSGGQIAQTRGIDIWHETFGDQSDPAMILIMGGCCQGILWPEEFCQKLVQEGFYVVRYDHRDMGLSTCFDFIENPYDLADLAQDCMDLMDYLGIEKAHLFGLSMGGPIAEIMAANNPEKILSIAVMSTSCDFRPNHLALQNKPAESGSLPGPTKDYLSIMSSYLEHPPETDEELLELRLEAWRVLNGSVVPFEEERERLLHTEFIKRLSYPQGVENHLLNNFRSEELVRNAPYLVHVPTVIFHGTEDPIFPLEHGKALAEAIDDSLLIVVEGMGHVPNGAFYDIYIEGIKENISRL